MWLSRGIELNNGPRMTRMEERVCRDLRKGIRNHRGHRGHKGFAVDAYSQFSEVVGSFVKENVDYLHCGDEYGGTAVFGLLPSYSTGEREK